jgi:hypothetical protein
MYSPTAFVCTSAPLYAVPVDDTILGTTNALYAIQRSKGLFTDRTDRSLVTRYEKYCLASCYVSDILLQ